MHKANGDYDMSEDRYLYRIMLRGDRPYLWLSYYFCSSSTNVPDTSEGLRKITGFPCKGINPDWILPKILSNSFSILPALNINTWILS